MIHDESQQGSTQPALSQPGSAPSVPSQPARRRPWGALLSLIAGVIILYLVFRKIDLREFADALSQTRWEWIGAALLCGLLSHWFRGLRWALLAEPLGHRPSAIKAFYAVMSGYLANLALPRLGEITRCLLLARKTPLGLSALFGSVVLERLLDLAVLMVLAFGVLLGYQDMLLEPVLKFVTTNLGSGVSLGFLVAFLLGMATVVVLWRTLGRLVPVPAQMRQTLADIGKGVTGLRHVPSPWLVGVYTALIWLGYYLMTYFCFFAFPGAESLGAPDAMLLLVAGAFGFVMPVQGGMGAYHAAIVWTLGMIPGLAMSPTTALAFATLSHLAQTVLVVLVGGLSYFLMSLYRDHQVEEPQPVNPHANPSGSDLS